jgi:hypothetical protein
MVWTIKLKRDLSYIYYTTSYIVVHVVVDAVPKISITDI